MTIAIAVIVGFIFALPVAYCYGKAKAQLDVEKGITKLLTVIQKEIDCCVRNGNTINRSNLEGQIYALEYINDIIMRS